jgi:transposase
MTDDQLIKHYLSGMTIKKIAATAGCHVQTIAKRIARLRDKLPYRREPLAKDHQRRLLAAARKALVVKLHGDGVPIREIARRVKITELSVRNMLSAERPKRYDAELARLQAELLAS